MAVPLSEILSGAKDLADYQNNPSVSDVTWRRWINQAQEELYRFLFRLAPERFIASTSFALSGGVNTAALAAGWRRVYGVSRDPTVAATRTTLRRFMFDERDGQGNSGIGGYDSRRAYDIQGNNLVIEPAQFSAGNYAYWYTIGPTKWATDGSQDATAINVIFEPYVDYLEHRAAINTLGREESDTSNLRVNLQQIRDDIEAEFGGSTEPATIVDSENTGGSTFWP